MQRVDYMTIDTEGSELKLSIIEDFPWGEFDVRRHARLTQCLTSHVH
jgi:hypothetical protein